MCLFSFFPFSSGIRYHSHFYELVGCLFFFHDNQIQLPRLDGAVTESPRYIILFLAQPTVWVDIYLRGRSFLYNSRCMADPILLCPVLYSFWASFLLSFTSWFIISFFFNRGRGLILCERWSIFNLNNHLRICWWCKDMIDCFPCISITTSKLLCHAGRPANSEMMRLSLLDNRFLRSIIKNSFQRMNTLGQKENT